MAKKTYVKQDGSWNEAKEIYVKNDGVWKNVKSAFVKDAGVWKQFFSSASEISTVGAVSSSAFFSRYTESASSTPTAERTSLTRTFTAGGSTQATLSVFVKGHFDLPIDYRYGDNTSHSGVFPIFSSGDRAVYIEKNNNIRIGSVSGSSVTTITGATFAFDFTKWHDITITFNGSNVEIFVDGVSQVTSSSFSFGNLNSTVAHIIGNLQTTPTDSSFVGYMSNFYWIDGQVLAPSNFATTSGGNRVPVEFSGTFGTNGFFLPFTNELNLGDDISGNNNDWTNGTDGGPRKAFDNPSVVFDLDLSQLLLNDGTWDGVNPVDAEVVLPSNVVIASTSDSTPALTTGALPSGSNITLTMSDNSYIVGHGGPGASIGGSGQPGGDAIGLNIPLTVQGSGNIWGGGGGSGSTGGGDGVGNPIGYKDAGATGAGINTVIVGPNNSRIGMQGEDMFGGHAASTNAGGDPGQPGDAATPGPFVPGTAGGSAGNAVRLNSNTLDQTGFTGSILGPVS